MNIESINQRIDEIIAKNTREEYIVIAMSVALFLIGVSLLVVEIIMKEVVFIGITALVNAFLYWPIKMILKIRRENITLASTITLLQALPPDSPEELRTEIKKLLSYIREGK